MKNLTILSICFSLSFFLFMSFTSSTSNNLSKSKNSLTVTVNSSSGSAKKGVRVVAEVCGGISCIGQTDAVYTDKNGVATITFSEGCKVCNIYLDGNSNKGSYKDGESYVLVR